MIFVRVHDVCLTSWFSFHYFFLTFMKLQVSWFLLIWIFFAYFHGFLSFFMTFARGVFSWRLCVFSLIGTISGFWCICIKLTTFHDFCVFSWCWQNFMIFTCFNEDGKILCFLESACKTWRGLLKLSFIQARCLVQYFLFVKLYFVFGKEYL